MAHWKKYMDKELLGAWDLEGRDVTVTIVDVSGVELNNGTKKNKKPVATIASASGRKLDKKLALNATNCKTIEQLAGSPDVERWKGLRVTLFPTTTQFGGETKECIRIRPYPPKDNAGRNGNGNGRGGRERGGEQPDLTQQIADKMSEQAAAPAGDDADDDIPDVPASSEADRG